MVVIASIRPEIYLYLDILFKTTHVLNRLHHEQSCLHACLLPIRVYISWYMLAFWQYCV